MSELSKFLEAQIKAQETTGQELAGRMGIDRTHFSQFLNERRKSCNVETLMKMADGISRNEVVQAQLLEAYFRDQCLPKYKPWIKVDSEAQWSSTVIRETPHDKPAEADPITALATLLRSLQLPEKVVEGLGWISRFIPGRPKFRLVIEDLGKFAREELERTH